MSQSYQDAVYAAMQSYAQAYAYPDHLGKPGDPGPDMPRLPRRTSTEPLRGYRLWRLRHTKNGYRIESPDQGVVWDGPILRSDSPPDDRSPWTRAPATPLSPPPPGQHGIYAWTLVRGPVDSRANRIARRVEGVVDLLGKVVVHEKGYRAEAVRIRRLQVFDAGAESGRAVADLSETYQCEVTLGQDYDPRQIRAPEVVDVEECPVCEKAHPENPLACETDEGGGLVRSRSGEQTEEEQVADFPSSLWGLPMVVYQPPSHPPSRCTLTYNRSD